jgi:hypothetical protein
MPDASIAAAAPIVRTAEPEGHEGEDGRVQVTRTPAMTYRVIVFENRLTISTPAMISAMPTIAGASSAWR